MKRCCIEGCELLSKKNVSYFEFPTSRLLRRRWLDAIRPPCVGKVAPDAVLCSRHFHTADYEDVRGKIRLKGKVVPTIFGDEAKNPKVLKDPLGLPGTTDTEESQESTATDKGSTSNDNRNGKVDNDNENIDNDNGNIGNDNNCKEHSKSPSRGATENGHNDTVCNDNGKPDNDNEITGNDNEKTDNSNKKTGNDNKNSDNDNRKTDNDNANVGNTKKLAEAVCNRKTKMKWVPMRKIANLNGHVDMSEDSTSQDSVNSDAPPQPVLEDLEEHLPNYHIANMKTERQVAAMAETLEPEELPVEEEELVVEPHIPVFIELSVGQDNNTPNSEEQPNDCLMVLESVQCDIDPTLMLEARAEEEECCEQIDLDDDDDDVVLTTDLVPSPAKISKKSPADPISLLTSSDEDDVILQEPHIDTLSVSDETDEDDLPLHKLMKREKKKQKKKKKMKPEPIKSILVAANDFYCMHCHHISACRSAHDKHLKTHKPDSPMTRVYQICKECGFTTASKSQLSRHQRKHINEKRFKCPLCTYRSKYNMSLMYHLKTHDFDPDMYNCGACGVECDSKASLLEHQAACYEMSEKFVCGICGIPTKSKRAMKIHRKTAHKQRV